MSLNELGEKINSLIENDDTENFYSLISEIIEENRDTSDIEQNLNEVFNIISDNINESNHEKKMSFICLFFEILISENIDFSIYLQKTFSIINQSGIYSDEYIKRIINICSNATIEKKALYNNLIDFSKNKIEYLYIIFSLAGFKDIIVDNISDSWELIIDLLDNPEIKSNSNSIKSVLKCLELLINLSETKFRPYASSALYQALDYLTETDTELQKRSLMIIYSLTKYCDEQLQPLSENIIDFLKVLQNGNNIEINNLCNTMLKHFTGENEDEENIKENENENNNDSNGNNNDNENIINNQNDEFNENDEIKMNNINEDEVNDNYENMNDNKNENINVNNNNENDNVNDDNEEKGMNLQNNYVKEEREEKEEEEIQDYNNKQNKIENKNQYEYEDEEEDNKYNYKKEDNNIQENENENDNDNEEEEDNKYNYRKKNVKEEINIKKKDNNESEKDFTTSNKKNITNNNNNNNLNNIDINAIIRKIKDLSDKQIIILDSIEQYKRDTKRIINQKKLKIQSLEAKIEELKEKIRIEKNKKRNKTGKTNYQMRRKNKNNYDDEDDQYNGDDYNY